MTKLKLWLCTRHTIITIRSCRKTRAYSSSSETSFSSKWQAMVKKHTNTNNTTSDYSSNQLSGIVDPLPLSRKREYSMRSAPRCVY